MSQIKETALVLSQENLAPGVYSMWIKTTCAKTAKPGQFITVYTKDKSKLLPRPISICQINAAEEKLRIVYRVLGAGTKEFSAYQAGDSIEVMGPLGNGFPTEGSKAILVGGGIGVPPMLGLAEALTCEKQIVMGYRDANLFLKEEFDKNGQVYIATDDGSVGTKGNVIDAIKANAVTGDVIYACGPTPMLRGLKAYAEEAGITLYISLEEKMACGIGACLACVCKTKEVDEHSNVHNKRICKDGPVFLASEVDL